MMPMPMFMSAFGAILALGALIAVAWFGMNSVRRLSGSSPVLIAGLILVFLGERVFGYSPWRLAVTGTGVAVVLASAALRAWVLTRSTGARRDAHTIALGATLAVIASLALYGLSLDFAIGSLEEERRATVR
nr:hypothetical protein [Deltaproteobacteria bacterium]